MSDLRDSLIIVTGAGGFIGSHVVERLLEEGARVRALVHYNALGSRGHLEEVASARPQDAARLEVVTGDIQDVRCVRRLIDGADCVMHLAALIAIPYSYDAPQSYVDVNIGGTLNVLEVCRDARVARLVHTSTSETLGTARVTPQDESHPLQAQSPYAATKIAADKLVESYARSFGVPAVTLRPFNTYGPRQSLRAVLPTILAQALDPACEEVRLGALDPVRDLTFVRDTADAFLAAARAPIGEVSGRLFHLGTGDAVSIGELARRACAMLGTAKPIVSEVARLRPEASEVLALVSDNRLAQQVLGWRPRVSLDDGIRATADWLAPRLASLRTREYVR